MKHYNDPIYKRYPEMFFSRCPAFSHTPERFQDICVNGGSQKVLLNLLSNLSRDWYWYFCRQFELTSVSMALYLMCESSLGPLYEKFAFRAIGYEEMPRYFQRISKLAGLATTLLQRDERLLVMKLQ